MWFGLLCALRCLLFHPLILYLCGFHGYYRLQCARMHTQITRKFIEICVGKDCIATSRRVLLLRRLLLVVRQESAVLFSQVNVRSSAHVSLFFFVGAVERWL